MKKQRILTLIGVLLILILFYLNWESIIEGLHDADYSLVLIAVLFWFLGGVLRAIRWRGLLNSGGEADIGLFFAIRALLGSFFIESIGPKISSDLYRGTLLWTASGKRVGFSKSFGVIVFERFLDFFLKLLIAFAGVILIGEAVSELGEGSAAAVIFSMLLLVGFALFLFLLSKEEVAIAISEKWVKIAGPKEDSLAGKIDPSELSKLANTFVSLAKSRRDLARSGTLTLGVFITDLLVWVFIFSSFEAFPFNKAQVDIFMLAFIMSVVTLAVFVSMFPGGYGVREIAASVALVWAGVASEVAVTAVIALRLFNLLMNIVVGGSFFVITSMEVEGKKTKKSGMKPVISENPIFQDEKKPKS
ncbi:MAG: YbhN family protein [Candidatus Hodarchaeota archaeon]